MALRPLARLSWFVFSLVITTSLMGCGGSDDTSAPQRQEVDDPFFGSQYGNAQAQENAALAIIDATDRMAEAGAGRAGDTSTAIKADDLLDEYSSTLYTWGEWFFDAKESAVLEAFLNAFGPSDPFKGKPIVDMADLKLGDILVSTTDARMSQVIRVYGWGHYSHAFVYTGDGMVTEAVGDGVQRVSLATSLKGAIRAGVLRDTAMSPAVAASVVSSANAKIGKAYNWKGLAAMAYAKSANLTAVATSGFSAMVAVLTTVDAIPGELGSNDTYFCSQLVTSSFKEGGNPLFDKDGASPNDIIRLGGGRLQIIGRLPLEAPSVMPSFAEHLAFSFDRSQAMHLAGS
jgi:uncharacterized protein YycO